MFEGIDRLRAPRHVDLWLIVVARFDKSFERHLLRTAANGSLTMMLLIFVRPDWF